MATKPYIYEEPRAPLRRKPSSDSSISVLRSDSRESAETAYRYAKVNKVHAPKTMAVWKHVLSTLLDPNQGHVLAVLRKIMQASTKEPDKEMQKMIKYLGSNPPDLTLLEFSASDDALALTDVTLRSRIFICSKLSFALEHSKDNSLLETQLQFLVFSALLHEMAHWLHFDPEFRRTSGHKLRYRDWHGENVGIKSQAGGRYGEAGYFLEGNLWGGIIDFVLPHKGIKGLYQKADGNTKRSFKNIGLILRHPGDVKETIREQIPFEAMVKRLTPGTIIQGFTDDELVPMFDLRRESREAWTAEDPTPKVDPEDEGKRRSKRRRLGNQTRAKLAIPDDVNILFATSEFILSNTVDQSESTADA
ncbi:hypothetical protein E4T56_gene16672 [Termitomyces sp. T112]|nr:hypothetical protein E4T56_gene16672 [Termitomyces sp. T112]